jgi:hypothetical protein
VSTNSLGRPASAEAFDDADELCGLVTVVAGEIESEADARTRTADPFITSEVLYQLSYVGAAWILACARRIVPIRPGLSREMFQ